MHSLKIAIFSRGEKAERIREGLEGKGHEVQMVEGGLKDYLDAVRSSEAILVIGELDEERAVALLVADYFGKRVLSTSRLKGSCLERLVKNIKVEVVG